MANWLSPFVTTRPVDTANIGMDTPTDCPRTETAASLMTEKQTCSYHQYRVVLLQRRDFRPVGLELRVLERIPSSGAFRSDSE